MIQQSRHQQRLRQSLRNILLITLCAILICVIHSPLQAQTSAPQQTTFILIRHAEKVLTTATTDPELSAEGQKRAEKFAALFQVTPFAAVYATPFKRTVNTAKPLAQALHLPIQQYAANSGEGFLDSLFTKHSGKTVLVVGHSNTIPTLLNTLSGTTQYKSFDDTDYDNIFIVTALRRGNAAVTHLRFTP